MAAAICTVSEDYAPRQTGGYQNRKTGAAFDIYELNGVSDVRSLAEADAVESHSTVTTIQASGFEIPTFTAGFEQVCYLDAEEGLCEKLVFTLSGWSNEAQRILSTLAKPVRVRLGDGPLSLYLPEQFLATASSGGTDGQTGAYADASSKRYVDVRFYREPGDFDVFVASLGKSWGMEGRSAQDYSLIIKYYIVDPVPAELRNHGAKCCMPCAIKLGSQAATVVFWADNPNFGWALKILRTLSAA